MTNEERNQRIDYFIEKWDEAIKAANEISDFKWNFKVSITSDNSLVDDRIKAINGITRSFSKNNMSWTSSNN